MENDYRSIFEKFPNAERSNMIGLLQEIQARDGYISTRAVKAMGDYLNTPASKIYSLASFYNQFRFEPAGFYHIQVCKGVNCHLERSNEILREFEKQLKIEAGQTTPDGMFSLEIVPCFGICHMGPVIAVNGETHPSFEKSRVAELIEHCNTNEHG